MRWRCNSDSDILAAIEEILEMEGRAVEEGDWKRLEALSKDACQKIEILKGAGFPKEIISGMLLKSERIEGELKERMKGIKEEISSMDISLHTHRAYMKGIMIGEEDLVLEWEA